MTDLELFNLLVVIMDTVTALGIVGVLLFMRRANVFPTLHRFGLYAAALGLLGQAYRSAVFLITGDSPSDNELAFWVLKDAGYWIIFLSAMGGVVLSDWRSRRFR